MMKVRRDVTGNDRRPVRDPFPDAHKLARHLRTVLPALHRRPARDEVVVDHVELQLVHVTLAARRTHADVVDLIDV